MGNNSLIINNFQVFSHGSQTNLIVFANNEDTFLLIASELTENPEIIFLDTSWRDNMYFNPTRYLYEVQY